MFTSRINIHVLTRFVQTHQKKHSINVHTYVLLCLFVLTFAYQKFRNLLRNKLDLNFAFLVIKWEIVLFKIA
jgi:hypothetical protein